MARYSSLRGNSLRRGVVGAAIAGLAVCALAAYAWWSVRNHGPSPDGFAGFLISVVIWLGVGATAGLISRRFRDALITWAAAIVGWWVAYLLNYTVFPGWATSDGGPEVDLLYAAIFLLPIIGGGHLLGVAVSNRGRRSVPDQR